MQFLTPIPRLLGTDGRKMSKSYNNAVYLNDPPEVVDRKIKPMMTDIRRQKRTDPGIPTDCPVFPMHRAFSTSAQVAEVDAGCRSAGIGCIDCKKIVIVNINEFLAPFRERRSEFEKEDLGAILAVGNQQAREAAQATMAEVRRQIWQ
jgi:tryptophanyl-tRNA synthetase